MARKALISLSIDEIKLVEESDSAKYSLSILIGVNFLLILDVSILFFESAEPVRVLFLLIGLFLDPAISDDFDFCEKLLASKLFAVLEKTVFYRPTI